MNLDWLDRSTLRLPRDHDFDLRNADQRGRADSLAAKRLAALDFVRVCEIKAARKKADEERAARERQAGSNVRDIGSAR